MENGQTRTKLIEAMNEALNRELSTAVRYLVQGAAIQGQKNEPLREMYRSEVSDEMDHAQYLADKIVALGGTPKPAFEFNPPAGTIDEMVRHDVAQEQKDVEGYVRLAELADKAGAIELKLRMEEQAADETRHAEELRRMTA